MHGSKGVEKVLLGDDETPTEKVKLITCPACLGTLTTTWVEGILLSYEYSITYICVICDGTALVAEIAPYTYEKF